MGQSYLLITLFIYILIGFVQDQTVEPDYDKIEYGGVWKSVIPGASVNDKDVDGAVQCALLYLKKKFLSDIVKNENLWNSYEVGNIRKLVSYMPATRPASDNLVTYLVKLIYTKNEKTPFYPVVLKTEDKKKVLVQDSNPVVFGMTYSFSVKWQHNFNVEKHSFTVTMYPLWEYYIYSHTSENPVLFTPVNINPNISYSAQTARAASSVFVNLESDVTGDNTFITRSVTVTQAEPDKDICRKPGYFSDAGMNSGEHRQCKTERLQQCLSVMSYNIWNFNAFPSTKEDLSYQTRIKHLTKLVLEHQPDVVVFQEVRFETGRGGAMGPSQVQHLSQTLPRYQFVYQPAQVMDTSLKHGRTEEGLAVFSRYPIIHHDFRLLFRNQTNSADLHQRLCHHVEIDVPGVSQPVHIFNTHLSLSHEAREESVLQMWDYIQSFKGAAILAGDFNSEPHEKSIQILGKHTSLTDTWTYIHGSRFPGFTFSTLNDELNKRIDFIFIRRQPGLEIMDVSVIDDGKKREEAASDHIPVMAVFGLS